MDVVRTNIEKIGGTVDVQSRPRQGHDRQDQDPADPGHHPGPDRHRRRRPLRHPPGQPAGAGAAGRRAGAAGHRDDPRRAGLPAAGQPAAAGEPGPDAQPGCVSPRQRRPDAPLPVPRTIDFGAMRDVHLSWKTRLTRMLGRSRRARAEIRSSRASNATSDAGSTGRVRSNAPSVPNSTTWSRCTTTSTPRSEDVVESHHDGKVVESQSGHGANRQEFRSMSWPR